jgi:hypothetical protein
MALKEFKKTSTFNLTDTAHNSLQVILIRDFGEKAKSLSNSEIDELGFRLLKLTAIALKRNTESSTIGRHPKDFSLRP